MQHPVIASANAKLRYDALVREADLYRQINGRPKNPSVSTRIVLWTTGLVWSLNNNIEHSTKHKTTA